MAKLKQKLVEADWKEIYKLKRVCDEVEQYRFEVEELNRELNIDEVLGL